jgi:hypothetical protein
VDGGSLECVLRITILPAPKKPPVKITWVVKCRKIHYT